MPKDLSNSTFVIVGAGPSGVFSARALQKAGVPAKNITLLTKDNYVGGKASDFVTHSVVANRGADLIASNYAIVLDAIFEKKLGLETVLPVKSSSMNYTKEYNSKSIFGKIKSNVVLISELLDYDSLYRQYTRFKSSAILPDQFNLPFADFAKKHGWSHLTDLLRPLVTGFGYGAMEQCPTYKVFEYLGRTTIPGMQIIPGLFRQGPFYAVKGGMQHLMEVVAEDFNVLKEVNIKSINRNEGIQVDLTQHGKEQQLNADYLILALSPLHWKGLGLDMNSLEKQITNEVTYSRYAVVVCNLKGYHPHHEFFEDGLKLEGFGNIALITTQDSSTEGNHICTVYINNPEGKNNYDLSPGSPDLTRLISQLETIEGVTKVEILDTVIWEDYMSSISWELCHALKQEQFNAKDNTGYCGSITAFEDVECVAESAFNMIIKRFVTPANAHIIHDNSISATARRLYTLFTMQKSPPASSQSKGPKEEVDEKITDTGIVAQPYGS